MTQRRTPGRLVALPEEPGVPYIRIRGTSLGARYKVDNVLAVDYPGAMQGVYEREAEETRGNARRLVAAWNACEGVSTENLEGNIPLAELAVRYNEALAALRACAVLVKGGNRQGDAAIAAARGVLEKVDSV